MSNQDRKAIENLNSKLAELKNEYRNTYGDSNLANLRNKIEAIKNEIACITAFAQS